MDELIKKQRDEGAEKNFKKMRWPCNSCRLSADPNNNQNFMKPLQDFGVRSASDFISRLLPQGSWTRCSSCQQALRGRLGILGKEGGKLGGNTNNEKNSERRLAAAQACETCTECGRMLPYAQYWPADWRHRTSKAIACKECRPAMPNKRPRGGGAANEQRAAEAAGRPITCKVCQRALPRSHFRPAANGKYYLTKGLTCEQCRAGGKLDKGGRKRKHSEED